MSDLVGNHKDRVSRVAVNLMSTQKQVITALETLKTNHEKTGILPMRKEKCKSAVQ